MSRSWSRRSTLSLRVMAFGTFVALGACSGATGSEDPGIDLDAAGTGDDGTDGATDGGIDGDLDGSASDGTSLDTSSMGADTSVDTRPVFLPDGACAGPVSIVGCGVDSDCDGIADVVEGRFEAAGARDTDKDGKPDYLDDDSDGDGIPDRAEWRKAGCDADGANDVDGDGLPNFRDLDSDGNGLPDKDELCPPATVLTALGMPACAASTPYDFDGDGTPDYLDFDNDHDSSQTDKAIGLFDKIELADATGKFVGLTLDTDRDGIPDVYDVDSDGDGIMDLDDGTDDDDDDGIAAFRDLDTDGDGVPDKCEARGNPAPTAADLKLPVNDTDLDGIPDYRDLDSDGDFLSDGKEDLNGNCVLDSNETSRTRGDTDADGHNDYAEVTLGGAAAARDATANPIKSGSFYFIVPYSPDGSAKPSPASTPLAFNTTINSGDVGFLVDTTTSMTSIENALADNISAKIIPGLQAALPDLNVGVVGYDDVLAKQWGDSAGDKFIWFPNGGTASQGSFVTATHSLAIAAAQGLKNTVTPGGSYPEGSVPALWWAITNDSFTFKSDDGLNTVKTWNTPTSPALPATRFGGMRFRKDALPILIQASDANMHNGLTNACYSDSVTALPFCNRIDYSTEAGKASSIGHTPTFAELKTKLNTLGAKYLGISVHGGGTGKSALVDRTLDPKYYQASLDMISLADATDSRVLPTDLDPTATTSDCKTSSSGAIANPAEGDGKCPLVFDIRYDGVGIESLVVKAVVTLLKAVKFDVHVVARDVVDGETVDAVDAFVGSVLPKADGKVTDPVSGVVCLPYANTLDDKWQGPKAVVAGTDTLKETILQANQGVQYCFLVNPKPNTTIPATNVPQQFKAELRVMAKLPAGGISPLGGWKQVIFVVPPVLN